MEVHALETRVPSRLVAKTESTHRWVIVQTYLLRVDPLPETEIWDLVDIIDPEVEDNTVWVDRAMPVPALEWAEAAVLELLEA
jgi:hypothetical protein